VPSRERPGPLRESLRSLGDADLELLVRVDEDDPCLDEYRQIGEVIVGPRHGYRRLHDYYNELALRASGDWLLLWNDDCLMRTPDWFRIVRSFDGKLAVLNPNTNHDNWAIDMNVFPIVPRQLVELIGHFSLSVHNDSWMEFVGRDAGIMVRVPIMIHHDRADLTGNNDDAVYASREYRHEEFKSERMQRARDRDVAVIQAYLASHPDAQPDPMAARAR
jgi:hypothetical protein